MKRLAVCVAGLLLAAATPLLAQPDPLVPGTRVRVSVPLYDQGLERSGSRAWQEGTVVRSDETHLTVHLSDGNLSIPLFMIRRLEVSEGPITPSDAWRRGARQGALAGAGAALGFAALGKVMTIGNEPCPREKCPGDNIFNRTLGPTRGELVVNMAVGAVAGGALGLLFGSRAEEGWTPVRVPGMGIAVTPAAAGGTGVTLSLRF